MIKKIAYAFVFMICLASSYVSANGYAAAGTVSQSNVTYIRGITNTLLTYPTQAKEILSYYVGVDTSLIDMDKFDQMVSNGNYNEIYSQVDTLYNNRVAFNNGTFTDVGYYKPETPVQIQATPAQQASAGFSKEFISGLKFYSALGVAAVGTAAAFSGGGGGGDGDGNQNWTTDMFNREQLTTVSSPDLFLTTEMTDYPLNALQKENAHYAYAKGLTGVGVSIGFYDIFSDNLTADSMSSRITYRSLNIAQDCADFPSQCSHGLSVMSYAADTKDNLYSFGVAYEASLMMHSWNAGSVTLMADAGADIINYSCSGCATISDLNYLTNRDIFVTISTGNDGGANPQYPARYAALYDYGVVAVTGVVDVNGTASSYGYDMCGDQMQYCMAAYSDSGTSFAAPQIAGAAALIKQGWDFLTAKQIGQILLLSAKDIGAAGVDAVFGHGLLDLKAAISPIGSVSMVSGSGSPMGYSPSAIHQNQNTAFGDAFSNSANASGSAVVIDSFGRDFSVTANDNLIVAVRPNMTPETMQGFGAGMPRFNKMQLNDQMALRYSHTKNNKGENVFASLAEYDMNKASKIKLGFANRVNDIISNEPQKFDRTAFISSDVFSNGFLNFSENNQVFYQGIELSSGKKLVTKFSGLYSRNDNEPYFEMVQNQFASNYASSMVETIYTPSSDLEMNFKNGMTHEFDSLLGTRFSGSFDMANGADTYFTGLDVSYDLMPDLNLFASYTMGVTQATPAAASSFSEVSDLTSDSFAVTATKSNVIGRDRLSFSVGQPTRVRSGTARGMTQQVDRSTGQVSLAGFQQDLTPSGRTLLFQTAYEKALSDKINMNFAFEYASQPDHQREKSAETSTLVKMVYKFN